MAERANKKKYCDIIIPFFNGLSYVRDCIESVTRGTNYPHKLILIDDGSDGYTKGEIKKYIEKFPNISLHINKKRLGFLKSCNVGLGLSNAEYVVLLNNDTYVLPNWLNMMVACAQSDKKIAIINPLSNMAVNLSIPIPPGLTIYTMADSIIRLSKHLYPDVVTAVGFCMMIKRKALEQLGFFDEVYGMGYCEESDYCMKAMSNGWRVVVADDAFVYHKGFGSFGSEGWIKQYEKNRGIFDLKWQGFYEKQHRMFLLADPLHYMREALFPLRPRLKYINEKVQIKLILSIRFFQLIIEALKKALIFFKNKELSTIKFRKKSIYARIMTKLKYTINRASKDTSLILRDIYSPGPDSSRGALVFPEYIKKLPPPRGITIIFLVYAFPLAGGVISIAQLVNEFIKKGHTALIATLDVEPKAGMLNLFSRPIRYRSINDMAKNFPKADIVVATFWATAYWYKKIIRYNPHVLPFYYIQDYESWFYRENNSRRKKVVESYSYIPNKIVKSDWLANMLNEHGYSAHKIHLGLNLDIFYPRGNKQKEAPYRILSIAAPDKPRRGFDLAVKVFEKLYTKRKDVKFIFFGATDLSDYNIPFPYETYGEIRDQNKVAELISSCHVVIDTSLFQGFGRLGLEAMACGTSTVLTKRGGINEYAKDGINCLMVNPEDSKAVLKAIEVILDNQSVRKKIIIEGRKTAQIFCHRDEAEKMLNLFIEKLEEHKKNRPSIS